MLSVALALTLFVSVSAPMCDTSDTLMTGCVRNDGSQIDIEGSIRAPGGSEQPARPLGGAEGNTGLTGPAAGQCGSPMCRPLYSVVSLPDVTIDDLASFRPATPSLAGEPDGFGVVGMPANIVAAA